MGRASIGPVQACVLRTCVLAGPPFETYRMGGQKMAKNISKHFRKRSYQAPGGNSSFALELRKIGKDASRKKHDIALARANQLLASASLDSCEQARVLSIVADCEFFQGHFERAAGIYLQAAAGCSDHHRLWFRPLLGHVRALLKVPQVDTAATMAQHALVKAKSKMADFDQAVQAANRLVSENQTVIVPALPIRTSVVATRLANLFMQEGEPEIARAIYEEAIRQAQAEQTEPNKVWQDWHWPMAITKRPWKCRPKRFGKENSG